MKIPLPKAVRTRSCAASSRRRGSTVEEITNSIGKLLPPGRAGGVVAMTRRPGMAAALAPRSAAACSLVRLRWLHGLVRTPPKPPSGLMIWKVWAVSGSDFIASRTSSE